MPDTYMTVIGNVCDEPVMRITKGGHAVTNFRMASTPRRFDREQNAWVDGDTLFVNVACWRGLAQNVKDSLKRGQAVVVYGRYYCKPYIVEESTRIGYQLEASVVGHDLNRGTAQFVKTSRVGASTDVSADEQGMPEDPAAHWYPGDGSEPAGPAGPGGAARADEVDPAAGLATVG